MYHIIKLGLILLIIFSPVSADNVAQHPECKHDIMINGLKDIGSNKNDPDTWAVIRNGPGGGIQSNRKIL
jgi:hypothetical protein